MWSPPIPFEAFIGVHRVQRVPETEKNGRRHSSTVTVVSDHEVQAVVALDRSDVDESTFRAPGAGGQHRNKTDSAVRLIHRPTGVVVTATESRSQHSNRGVAWRRLEERLAAQERSAAKRAADEVKASAFGEAREWTWCGWRDSVTNGTRSSSMRRSLKGRLDWVQV